MNFSEREGPQKRQWTFKEDLNYYYFMFLYVDLLDHNKKTTKFFIEMSKFIDKTPDQCRSHHNKKLKTINSNQSSREKKILKKFYYQNFTIRHLSISQLQKQLTSFLQQKQKQYTSQLKHTSNDKDKNHIKLFICKIAQLKQKIAQKLSYLSLDKQYSDDDSEEWCNILNKYQKSQKGPLSQQISSKSKLEQQDILFMSQEEQMNHNIFSQ